MSWLKSPWFWLIVILAAIGVWWAFFRPRATSGSIGAPLQLPGGGGVAVHFGAFNPLAWLEDIGTRWNSGETIMDGGGSR